MTALVNRFNQENTQGIKVTHLPQQDYITKLGTASASNTLPDMTVIRGEDIATQAARNILRPFPAEAMSIVNLSASDFPASIWSQGQYKNQRFTIPLDVHPIIMYYNKDMFQAAGISAPPKTGADLEAAAAKLNQNGVYGWSVTTGVFPTQFLFQTLLHQYGGSEFNADGTQATFNSDAGVKALTYLRDAQSKYAKPNLPQDAGVTAFKQGKSAIEMNGIWQTSSLVTNFKSGATAPIPQWGEKYAVWASTHELAFTNQKNPDPKKAAAGGCWISWLSANSADWSKAGNIPARNAVRTGSAFQGNQELAPVAPEADAAFFQPNIPGIGDALAPMADAVNAVTAGQQSDIKKALDDAATKSNQILQQAKQRYG
jgi:multiple sugar transport system substrate-binding protein